MTLRNTYPFVQIRYTTDGTDPNETSPLFRKTLKIDQNITLKARSIFPGGYMSKIITGTYEKQLPADAVKLSREPKPGLNYHYFEGAINTLKDFNKMKEISADTITAINLSPAKVKENFGFTFDGYVKLPVDSIYTFVLASDDGSKLTIDDKMIIDNDGVHGAGEIRKQLALQSGYHKIDVQYFQALYGAALKLYITGPGLEKQEIPGKMFFH